ncbi:Aprataxin [Drechslerella dactyloides]|uniref:Aprataxin n=1 Tax=Drechslerella dactyloides TaxID=74499 RepID=A0AAD6IX72_DREDA|nr:Aprataxin [Drechslerella dactyloides]
MDEPAQNPRSHKRVKPAGPIANDSTDSDDGPETPPGSTFSPDDTAKPVKSTPGTSASQSVVKKNAFHELMTKKPKPPADPIKPPSRSSNPYYLNNDPRSGLAAYLSRPESMPSGSILLQTADFIVIKDAFPKATVHALILPRDIALTWLHPVEVLNSNPSLLSSLHEIAEQTRTLLAKELLRTHGKYSATEQIREKAFEALEQRAIDEPGFDPDSEESQSTLPPHRDWAACIRIGVHSRPSMSNLHVHVISEDMHSERLKKKNHFNSFNSRFFVPLDEFPLAEDDPRIPDVGSMSSTLKGDMVCWRCKRNFGNKFKELKEHLEVEYQAWRQI